MKKIYFVRHGESIANHENIHQGSHGSLSLRGKQQADFLARRFKAVPVEIVISSTHERARETAEIIGRLLAKPIEFSDLFVERKNPSEILGKSIDDLGAKSVRQRIQQHYFESGWRHSDEENFELFKARGLMVIDFLLERAESRLLCVLHGGIIRMVVALMMFGSTLTAQEFIKFLSFAVASNTGITLVEYTDEKRWRLFTWNDHAHLG